MKTRASTRSRTGMPPPCMIWNLALILEQQGETSWAEKLYAQVPESASEWADAVFRLGYLRLLRDEGGEMVTRVDTADKVVALTFDDGPTPAYTAGVLGVLAAHDARATFYLTGREAKADPADVRAIVAAGHELGNHTYDHGRLYFLPASTVADQVERTDAVFREAGYTAPTTFRMPGCKRLVTTPLYLARTGRTTVLWDLEPDSIAKIADDPYAMIRYVADGVRPGSIVLMHVMYDSRSATREALPHILEELTARGYRFVTVSELLALR